MILQSHAAQAVIRLLFIGNSLTAANDLPAMVQALGRAAGVEIACTAIAKPDFSLEDHREDGEARRAIARGGWTFVILQQGPSALPESRVVLEDYARRFDREIRAVVAGWVVPRWDGRLPGRHGARAASDRSAGDLPAAAGTPGARGNSLLIITS